MLIKTVKREQGSSRISGTNNWKGTTMTREQAIKGYQRVKDLEQKQSKRLREEILIPYFGGCGCRLHNCIVNYESGVSEGDGHAEQVRLAKQFDHRQAKIWQQCREMCDRFGKHF